jgi:hypothetical protein
VARLEEAAPDAGVISHRAAREIARRYFEPSEDTVGGLFYLNGAIELSVQQGGHLSRSIRESVAFMVKAGDHDAVSLLDDLWAYVVYWGERGAVDGWSALAADGAYQEAR